MQTLQSMPSEVHHEIFSYLDYVLDVCAHHLLFVPTINMPATSEEFEKVILADENIEFDEKPTNGGLLVVCKSILESVRSYRPTILNITTIYNTRTCGQFPIDSNYCGILQKFKWLSEAGEKPKDCSHEWIELFRTFIRNLKNLCHGNPFRKVEFVSFSAVKGKNFSAPYSFDFSTQFYEFMKLVPSVRHYHMDFNGKLNVDFLNYKFPSTNITFLCACGERRTEFSTSGNVFWNRFIDREHGHISASITEFTRAQPIKFQRNVEALLFNVIISLNFHDAQHIIDNFNIDIDYFSYIWNVQPLNYRNVFTSNNLHSILATLQQIHAKYPTFRVFKMPIYNLESLKIIKNYPFVDINVGRNITTTFLELIFDKEEVISFCHEYNVDISRLGKYQFSVASFLSNCFERSKIKLDPNSKDIFGITPCMLFYNPTNKPDITIRDNFGNNILHYCYTFQSIKWVIKSYKDIPYLQNLPDNELKNLTEQPNMFGVTPKEISFSYMTRMNIDNFSKVFDYNAFESCCDQTRPSLLLMDGLQVDMRIFYASINQLPSNYSYEDYKDINYRDINGKHIYHYCANCFSDSVVSGLEIPLIDIAFCKDKYGTLPVQTSNLGYYPILLKMSVAGDVPNFNFVSYANNFGMYRIMYLLISSLFTNFNSTLIYECNTIGFDYVNGQAQLISLCFHYSNCKYHFSLETNSLEQLKNISYFGTVDGDDISHFVVRFYFHSIVKRSAYVDYLFLQALIGKGLRLDIVRNSQGKTAFDLFDEMKGFTCDMMKEIAKLKKICKRGLTTKSKALSKFRIKHKHLPKECIIEDTGKTLVTTCDQFYNYGIKVYRTLFFE